MRLWRGVARCLLALLPVLTACRDRSAVEAPRVWQTGNTTQIERERFARELQEQIIAGVKGTQPDSASEPLWENAFWGMTFARAATPLTFALLKSALARLPQRSVPFQRAALEAVYTLYPHEFAHELAAFAVHTNEPKLFAMAMLHLQRAGRPALTGVSAPLLLRTRFPNWEQHPILTMLAHDLQEPRSQPLTTVPPLVDLFRHRFGQGEVVIFSLQRRDRDYPGLTVMRNSEGRFVRTPAGSLFHIAHLARAVSNLPGYLTNGNTPQGVLSIRRVYTSENEFIGPSPALEMYLPVEVSLPVFLHDSTLADTVWTLQRYQQLLPESWRHYFPFSEAYHAGAAGRTEIFAHGTTIDPEFYRGEPYYPNTPSLGCLTALEIWSRQDGRLLLSDQHALIAALRATGREHGFCVVVEVDDKPQPVALHEVLPDILQAEGTL